jgi:transposase InsO family protein
MSSSPWGGTATTPAAYSQIAHAKDQALKYDVRLKMVQYAEKHGVKPAARAFGCQPRIVRKWLKRWYEGLFSRASLLDRSRAPKTCPHKTSKELEARVIAERKKAPCLGARRLKEYCELPPSEGAIGRILRQNGLAQKRKKKYEKKRDMREMKAKWQPFENPQVDTKYLNDIPFYVDQMMRHPWLPRFEYTYRDPKTGCAFLGFAHDISEAHACAFIAAVGAHLKRCGFDPKGFSTIQTDNGSEYSGAERHVKNDRGFTHVVEHLLGARHRFIPPGKKNHQADVETFHHRIEVELFDSQHFTSRQDFFRQTTLYQLWWNTTRKTAYKGSRTPDQILLEAHPGRNPAVWMLPTLDLDALVAKRADTATRAKGPKRGYYVPALPDFPPASAR